MGGYVSVIVNVDQAAAWDGHEGDVWTEQADRYDRAVDRIWRRFLAAEPVTGADRVLDVGCGTGRATVDLARIAAGGSALGIDLSTRMLDRARRRAADAGVANATFVRGDAQVFPFEPGAADVVVSSFGAMFFDDPVAAFTNLARALRPGGTLQLLAWRPLPENEWLRALRSALAVGRDLPLPPPDAPTPFSLADPARVRRVLDAAGFGEVELEAIDEPMCFGSTAADALDFAGTMGVVEGLTDGLDDATKATAMANVAELFSAHETADGVLLDSAAWRISGVRRG